MGTVFHLDASKRRITESAGKRVAHPFSLFAFLKCPTNPLLGIHVIASNVDDIHTAPLGSLFAQK